MSPASVRGFFREGWRELTRRREGDRLRKPVPACDQERQQARAAFGEHTWVETGVRFAVGLLCTWLSLVALAVGQKDKSNPMGGVRVVPGKVGFWHPWPGRLPAKGSRMIAYRAPSQQLTGQQALVIYDKLAGLADVFRKAPILNPPFGLEVEPRRLLEFEALPPGPICSRLMILLPNYETSCDTCAIVLTYPWPEVDLHVNSIETIYDTNRPFREDEQGDMYRAPKVIGYVDGFPEYNTGYIVLTKIRRPLWLPVSQERFLRHEIRAWREKLKVSEAGAANGSTYQQWRRDSEKRRRDREQSYNAIKQVDPKKAHDYLVEAEKTEREVTEKLRVTDAGDSASLTKGVESLRGNVRALEDELASLSPAARAAPAYYRLGGKNHQLSGLTDANTPGADLIVETNKDFFDGKQPTTSFQLLAVWGLTGQEEDLHACEATMKNFNLPRHVPAAKTALDLCFIKEKFVELRRTLDWKLLAALLDEGHTEIRAPGDATRNGARIRR